MTCHIIVAISKSNWFYTVNRSDQLGAVSVAFSFFANQTAIIQAIQQVILERYEYTESYICLSKLLDRIK